MIIIMIPTILVTMMISMFIVMTGNKVTLLLGSFCLIEDASNIEHPRWADIVKKPWLISCLAQMEIRQDFRSKTYSYHPKFVLSGTVASTTLWLSNMAGKSGVTV